MVFENVGLPEMLFLVVPGIITYLGFRLKTVVFYPISFLACLFLGVSILVDVAVLSVYCGMFLVVNVLLAVGEFA